MLASCPFCKSNLAHFLFQKNNCFECFDVTCGSFFKLCCDLDGSPRTIRFWLLKEKEEFLIIYKYIEATRYSLKIYKSVIDNCVFDGLNSFKEIVSTYGEGFPDLLDIKLIYQRFFFLINFY